MSGITLEQAQAQLDKLLAAQSSGFLAVSVGGRTTTYRSAADLIEAINYWTRVVAGLQREADGSPRHGISAAAFRSRQ